MSIDISSQFTKERNLKTGRKGYCNWKNENVNVISPKEFGIFLQNKKKGGKTL